MNDLIFEAADTGKRYVIKEKRETGYETLVEIHAIPRLGRWSVFVRDIAWVNNRPSKLASLRGVGTGTATAATMSEAFFLAMLGVLEVQKSGPLTAARSR